MTTAYDVVRRALERSRIYPPGEPVPAEHAQQALDELNDMMSSWSRDGCQYEHTAMTLQATFPLDAKHRGGVQAMLAVRLSSVYGSELDAATVALADDGWQGVLADPSIGQLVAPMTFDAGLIYTPGYRAYRRV